MFDQMDRIGYNLGCIAGDETVDMARPSGRSGWWRQISQHNITGRKLPSSPPHRPSLLLPSVLTGALLAMFFRQERGRD